MNASVAIQVLPNVTDNKELCRIVDEVIAYIKSQGLKTFVSPFETTIEGDYDLCMEVLKNCQIVGARAGCGHVMTFAKIDYRPGSDVMSTEHKIGKYHPTDSEFSDSGLSGRTGAVA